MVCIVTMLVIHIITIPFVFCAYVKDLKMNLGGGILDNSDVAFCCFISLFGLISVPALIICKIKNGSYRWKWKLHLWERFVRFVNEKI